MARYAVKVEKLTDRLSLHFSGPNVAHANEKLIHDCFGALLDCADKNACFTKGFTVECLATIARHDKQDHCVSKAFGFIHP